MTLVNKLDRYKGTFNWYGQNIEVGPHLCSSEKDAFSRFVNDVARIVQKSPKSVNKYFYNTVKYEIKKIEENMKLTTVAKSTPQLSLIEQIESSLNSMPNQPLPAIGVVTLHPDGRSAFCKACNKDVTWTDIIKRGKQYLHKLHTVTNEDMEDDKLDRFFSVYTQNLIQAVTAYPEKYAYGLDKIPSVVDRLKKSMAHGVLPAGDVMTKTCKQLGFQPTFKSFSVWLKSVHESSVQSVNATYRKIAAYIMEGETDMSPSTCHRKTAEWIIAHKSNPGQSSLILYIMKDRNGQPNKNIVVHSDISIAGVDQIDISFGERDDTYRMKPILVKEFLYDLLYYIQLV